MTQFSLQVLTLLMQSSVAENLDARLNAGPQEPSKLQHNSPLKLGNLWFRVYFVCSRFLLLVFTALHACNTDAVL